MEELQPEEDFDRDATIDIYKAIQKREGEIGNVSYNLLNVPAIPQKNLLALFQYMQGSSSTGIDTETEKIMAILAYENSGMFGIRIKNKFESSQRETAIYKLPENREEMESFIKHIELKYRHIEDLCFLTDKLDRKNLRTINHINDVRIGAHRNSIKIMYTASEEDTFVARAILAIHQKHLQDNQKVSIIFPERQEVEQKERTASIIRRSRRYRT